MANFLNRLAARALGVAHVAQPVIPGLFTPGFGLERSEPPLDFAVEIANPSERSTPSESARQATLPGPVEASNSNTVPRASLNASLPESFPGQEELPSRIHKERLPISANEIVTTQPAASPTVLNSLAGIQPAEVDSYVPDQVSGSSAERALNQLSGSSPLTATAPVVTEEVPHARRQTLGAFRFGRTIPTNPRTMSARRDHASTSESEAPVIRVTIGRIDVRAEFPASAPSPATRHARPAALSLDEYSKQRSEGKR